MTDKMLHLLLKQKKPLFVDITLPIPVLCNKVPLGVCGYWN